MTFRLKILQVNTADAGGGAENSSRLLMEGFRQRGHSSWLAVGQKRTDDPDVLELPLTAASPGVWEGVWGRVQRILCRYRAVSSCARGLSRLAGLIAEPQRIGDWWAGRECFAYPGSRRLLDLPGEMPDVVHCHNLHGKYFDLSYLPELSKKAPVVLNLRDAWLLTGHCAHFFDCDRWRLGCGQCPYLASYPSVRRDNTAANWQRKAEIYGRSRLYVTSPAKWLVDCVGNSMLHAVGTRVIPNGVDTAVFHPGSKAASRKALALPEDHAVLLFVFASGRKNYFKDFETLLMALEILAGSELKRPMLFLCLGDAPRLRALDMPGIEIRAVPFVSDPGVLADHYKAADLYVHSARAETYPRTIVEALACGTPVVATAVGGIPEQVETGRNGLLVAPGDANDLAQAIQRMLRDDQLRSACAGHASASHGLYSLDRQVEAFLDWYSEIIEECE